ncbi:MAG: dihydrolipoamide acetyltransferase family protein [Actinomycetota bacterium]|nr:dihydrolipoamide acetyltransferase family protein [Actinomycetota bacterium]
MDVVTLPRLGVTMTSAVIVAWEKKEGDFVRKGELLVVIESEKATIELESPYEGVLRKILVEEEEEAQVGQPIAVIAGEGEELDVEEALRRWEAERAEKEAAPYTQAAPAAPAAAAPAPSREGGRAGARVSPRVRKLAEELGVDLAAVAGTGPDGVITEKDVRAAATGPAIKAKVKLNQVRKAMSARMLSSWQNIPQFTQMATVNAERLLAAKAAMEGVSINDLAVKAVADAVAKNPEVNSSFADDTVTIYEDVNVSVAMATEQGLVVPVVKNAERKTAREIGSEIRELQERAAAGQLTSEDLSGGTITVSNLGFYGVETGTPIINPPQSCMVFVGSIRRVAVAGEGDEIRVAPVLELSIAYDHRFIDGMTASRFTTGLKEELENISP